MTPTIGSLLKRNNGLGPGFDFVRVSLAICVVLSHSSQLLFVDKIKSNAWWFTLYSILPMFFLLSGFLVTGSAMRLNLKDFLINRGARIVPALFVEIVLSAFIIGPLLTNLSLRTYFSDPRLYYYLLNIFGYIHYDLPGLFRDNPFVGVVNGSLWTIPHEIACYVLMSVVIVTGALSSAKRIWWFFLISILFLIAAFSLRNVPGSLGEVGRSISLSASQLIVYFVLGIFAYLVRYRIVYSPYIFVVCCILYLLISFLGNAEWERHATLLRAGTAPILAYVVLFIGLTSVPKIPFYSRGDYSYGIYLYSFVIQQSILELFPDKFNLFWFSILSIGASTAFAMFSWHLIEKPALRLRRHFSSTMKERRSPQPAGIPMSESI